MTKIWMVELDRDGGGGKNTRCFSTRKRALEYLLEKIQEDDGMCCEEFEDYESLDTPKQGVTPRQIMYGQMVDAYLKDVAKPEGYFGTSFGWALEVPLDQGGTI